MYTVPWTILIGGMAWAAFRTKVRTPVHLAAWVLLWSAVLFTLLHLLPNRKDGYYILPAWPLAMIGMARLVSLRGGFFRSLALWNTIAVFRSRCHSGGSGIPAGSRSNFLSLDLRCGVDSRPGAGALKVFAGSNAQRGDGTFGRAYALRFSIRAPASGRSSGRAGKYSGAVEYRALRCEPRNLGWLRIQKHSARTRYPAQHSPERRAAVSNPAGSSSPIASTISPRRRDTGRSPPGRSGAKD